MSGSGYRPRKMSIEELVSVLVSEHGVMKAGLLRAKDAATRHDFQAVGIELRRIDIVFRQHIADEESQILRLLVGRLGKEGAADEIRVFQQHRPIYALMQKLSELAEMSSDELATRQAELDALFEEHTEAEQSRVFPRVLSLMGESGKTPADV